MVDFTVIGGGIVGLSVGHAIQEKFPQAKLLLLEKETALAAHQTGRNSGVIHSGIYYKPGSYKARFATAGSRSMRKFCRENGVEVDICGKVIVATKPEQLPLLDSLLERGRQNGLDLQKLTSDELVEREPHVRGLAAIDVPMAGIVSYKQVAEKLAEKIRERDGEIRLDTKVQAIAETADGVVIDTSRGTFRSKFLVNCAGLHSDRIAKMAGYPLEMKIVPFRGEYFKLKPEKRYLVKHLIYPVPDPKFPFLGVHFTRMIDGEVDAGPNAVLSLKREGYKKTDIDWRDMAEIFAYKGFWKIARTYMKVGLEEMIRSASKKKFVASLQELIPEIKEEDLIPGPSGVRAQALTVDGKLVDDFHLVFGKNCLHVCNAPSPAATASLEIGKEVAGKVAERLQLV